MTFLQVRTTKLSLCFRSSLSRFAQASTAALIVLVLAGAARADTIKDFFIKNGTATNVSGGNLFGCLDGATCSFSGTMMVDVTSSAAFPDGTVTAYDITFPGVAPFSCCSSQGPSGSGWFANSNNSKTSEAKEKAYIKRLEGKVAVVTGRKQRDRPRNREAVS